MESIIAVVVVVVTTDSACCGLASGDLRCRLRAHWRVVLSHTDAGVGAAQGGEE